MSGGLAVQGSAEPGKTSKRESYPVCRAINRPLTIAGAERRLFFLAAVMAGATFNFFGSLRGAALIFAALYGAARWVTSRDLAFPWIFFNSARFRTRYDAARFEPIEIMRVRE